MTPQRGLNFGTAAAAYERFRPSYPDAVVEAVVAYATGPVRTALEIGAGTGKATRVFAARGIAVTASDPDPAMLAELRRHVTGSVTTVQATLEQLPDDGGAYDLVFAAAALHWTRREGRWERVARRLRPAGVFASFGGPVLLADDQLTAAVGAARAPWLAGDEVPSPDATPATSTMQWPGGELEHSALFTDVRELVIERRLSMSSEDYLGLLSTVSAYLQLSDDDRRRVFAAIAAVLPDEVALNADQHLHLATVV